MPKKAAKTSADSTEKAAAAAAPAPKPAPKKAAPRAKKHVAVQARAVVAAVETAVETFVAAQLDSHVVEPAFVEEPALFAATYSEEDVAKLAYEFYLDRNGDEGSPADDWFRALETLKARAARA